MEGLCKQQQQIAIIAATSAAATCCPPTHATSIDGSVKQQDPPCCWQIRPAVKYSEVASQQQHAISVMCTKGSQQVPTWTIFSGMASAISLLSNPRSSKKLDMMSSAEGFSFAVLLLYCRQCDDEGERPQRRKMFPFTLAADLTPSWTAGVPGCLSQAQRELAADDERRPAQSSSRTSTALPLESATGNRKNDIQNTDVHAPDLSALFCLNTVGAPALAEADNFYHYKSQRSTASWSPAAFKAESRAQGSVIVSCHTPAKTQ
jgi:hypothetical protein